MSEHAQFSPSSAHRWMTCAASVALEAQCPDESSSFADEGTAAHELAALALANGHDAKAYLGRLIEANGKQYEVDDDMAGHVQTYIDYVRALGGELMIEQRLSIEHITGEKDAKGTSDAVVLLADELIIVDLKFGRGVEVDADENEQLMIYAAAALAEFEFLGDFKRIRHVIVQPRRSHISEWTCSVEALRTFESSVKPCVERGQAAVVYLAQYGELHPNYFNVSEDACRFCKAKANCQALATKVQQSVEADFAVIAHSATHPLDEKPEVTQALAVHLVDDQVLADKMAACGLIEDWIKAVRAEVERRLLAGQGVPGYKLVQGKQGNRAWSDKDEAEALLKSMRLKVEEMYDLSLISPTTAEKLTKAGTIGPKQWKKVEQIITRAAGKPSVAPESDKRPALVVTPTADDFANVSDEVADLV